MTFCRAIRIKTYQLSLVSFLRDMYLHINRQAAFWGIPAFFFVRVGEDTAMESLSSFSCLAILALQSCELFPQILHSLLSIDGYPTGLRL